MSQGNVCDAIIYARAGFECKKFSYNLILNFLQDFNTSIVMYKIKTIGNH